MKAVMRPRRTREWMKAGTVAIEGPGQGRGLLVPSSPEKNGPERRVQAPRIVALASRELHAK
jgi:hypothetical protein